MCRPALPCPRALIDNDGAVIYTMIFQLPKGLIMSGLFGDDVAGRIAARMLQDDYDPDEAHELFSMSLRVPDPVRAMLDAMAVQAGVSRNTMAIDVIRAGIQDVLSKLPDGLKDELIEEAGGYL